MVLDENTVYPDMLRNLVCAPHFVCSFVTPLVGGRRGVLGRGLQSGLKSCQAAEIPTRL